MARMGLVIVIGAIIGSMVLANYMYMQYQTNFIEVSEGETVIVGPVEYIVTFEGTHEGDKETEPENHSIAHFCWFYHFIISPLMPS